LAKNSEYQLVEGIKPTVVTANEQLGTETKEKKSS